MPISNISHRTTGISFPPEENPFTTVMVDLTHRCNMECRNCYVPNREIPDLDLAMLYDAVSRFPRRTRIRLSGGEPTVRKDIPDIVRTLRAMGHLPVLMSNGLKLANRDYVARLKAAGLRTLHLSMNGGLRDDLYQALDDMACAPRKLSALDVLCEANFFVTVGMLLSPGINDDHVPEFYRYLRDRRRQVREFHLRNSGAMGRHMDGARMTMDDLIDTAAHMTDLPRATIERHRKAGNYIDFVHDGMHIQLTDWPDLGNPYRGRLTPQGRVEPAMEHIIANNGGY